MEMMEQRKSLNKLTLQIIAMATMLIDHIGMALLPDIYFLYYIGRLAFPIFAFFVVEGCEKTHHFPRYIGRMTVFAVLSEIPFDLAHGSWWDLENQNVLWTFLLAMLCIYVLKKLQPRRETVSGIFLSVLTVLLGFILGELMRTDYGGFGVLVVLVFWACRNQPWRYGAELLALSAIWFRTIVTNLVITGEFLVPTQGLALLALPLLWLYDGTQGPHNKTIQYVCYAFYPVHLLILGLIALTLR